MDQVGAWLLNFGGGRRAAVGVRELVHIAYAPQLVAVPQTPPHCSRVLVEQERIVPAWDVAAWLGAAAPGRASSLAAIIGHQTNRRGPVTLGALLIAEPPVRITVGDEDACELPRTSARWRAISMSCVRYNGEPLPILDLRLMFSDALSAGRSTSDSQSAQLAEIH